MSQRRGGGGKIAALSADENVPLTSNRQQPQVVNSLELESAGEEPNNNNDDDLVSESSAPLSIEERYENERYNQKIAKWKESPFACGLTEITWAAEQEKFKRKSSPGDDDHSVDSANCLCFSAAICPHLGAERVGNMSVFKTSTITINVDEEDVETGEIQVVRVNRPKLEIVVGPYWPMLLLVTYPLIFGISGWTLVRAIPGKPPLLQLGWTVCTLGLIVALAFTSFRDPGIMYRRRYPPAAARSQNSWRWSDQALTFRPRTAVYDADTGVVVEGFDHTCPWTGTAIGRKNMLAFQFFVCLVFLCMIFDILLLTNSFGTKGPHYKGPKYQRPHYE